MFQAFFLHLFLSTECKMESAPIWVSFSKAGSTILWHLRGRRHELEVRNSGNEQGRTAENHSVVMMKCKNGNMSSRELTYPPLLKVPFESMIFSSFIDGNMYPFPPPFDQQVQLQGQGRGWFTNVGSLTRFWGSRLVDKFLLGSGFFFVVPWWFSFVWIFSGNGFWWSLRALVFFAEKKFVGKRPWLWKQLWIWDRMMIQKTIQSLFGGRIFSS